jgi:hypothetical protein
LTDFVGLVILGCALIMNYNLNLKPLAKVKKRKNQDKPFGYYPGFKYFKIILLRYKVLVNSKNTKLQIIGDFINK